MGNLHGSQGYGGPNKKAGETGPNVSGCLGTTFDDHRKAEWLEVIRQCGRRSIANTKVGVHRRTVEIHLKKDPKFYEGFEDAMQFFRESLVNEAVRRGVRGVDEPIFSRGRRALDIHPDDADRLSELEKAGEMPRMIPATIRRYSDTLLHALLKAHNPEFTDKQIVETAKDSDSVAKIEELSESELDDLQRFLQSVKERKSGTETDVS